MVQRLSVASWLLLLAGCRGGVAVDAPKPEAPAADAQHLTFGSVFEASSQQKPDWKNPHLSTAYAVGMCRDGRSKALVAEMGHVQEDAELGKALLTFVKEFGPDLERYKGKELYLKFHGYFLDKDTSIWYYWLTDKAGSPLQDSPWVSSRRSLRSERSALTGIFLRDPDIKDSPGPMPKGLTTASGPGK